MSLTMKAQPLKTETRCIPLRFSGKTWKFGNNINAESILPTAAYHEAGYNEDRLKREILAFYDPEFGPGLEENDILVAGTNFGCSSSRPAAFYLKYFGVAAVFAESVSQIFYRNALSVGLPILEAPGISSKLNKGDKVEVDLEKGTVKNVTLGQHIKIPPLPKLMRDVIEAGDILKYEKHRLGLYG
jgi:3-isopropylmalate/(R)-2-methylmalate dehydratase small subunit